MAKHRKQQSSTVRNVVAFAAAGVGVATLAPATAQAAPITVPSTDIKIDAPDHVSRAVQPHIDNAHREAVRLGLAKQAAAPAQSLKKAAPAKQAPVNVGQKIADFAKGKVGAPYAWGGTGPAAFDCSGLTSWAYKQVGKNIPRTSQAQASGGKQVSLKDLRPGDIVSYYGGASHVAIYIGGGKVVQALNSSTPVSIDDLHYLPVYNAVRF